MTNRGVSVDAEGNIWVADTFNHRVLRFAPGSKKANLVLGQNSFYGKENGCASAKPPTPVDAPLNLMCSPHIAKIDPETGELYVVDEHPSAFRARILVFKPPFRNGMSADRAIIVKHPNFMGWGYYSQVTGLEINTFKQGEYADGVVWVTELNSQRVSLLDGKGNVIKVIGAQDANRAGCDLSSYERCGIETPLCQLGGPVALDNHNNIYIADEYGYRIVRFSLPYTPDGSCLPDANAEILSPNDFTPSNFDEIVGAIVFNSEDRNQLIVRDRCRYLIWGDYINKPSGSPADFVLPPGSEYGPTGDCLTGEGRSPHAIDDKNRLWLRGEHNKLMVFQLPLNPGQKPIAENIKLYWADNGELLDLQGGEVAFDPVHKAIWIAQANVGLVGGNRLLRISNYDDVAGPDKKLYVDMVIGQPSKKSLCCNQMAKRPDGTCLWGRPEEIAPPTANSLCQPYDIAFDKEGNLFVVEGNYECKFNDRITVFMAEDIASATGMFPNLEAKRVFVSDDFTQKATCLDRENAPTTPVTLAFNSKGHLVVGNDGYYFDEKQRPYKQLWLYLNPLEKQTPDYSIQVPMGAPGEMWFDNEDNFIIQDHTWTRVWVINFEKDPFWLVPAS